MRLKKAAFYLTLTIIPIAFFFMVFEWAAPVFVKAPHLVYKFWGNRPVTFYPGMTHRAVTDNYDVFFKANSLGFKDKEHSFRKKKGVIRVVLLGDSYIEAAGVPCDKHMARIIENLAAKDGLSVEVIAMGMSGYGQSHYLATYERAGKKFQPDMVITFFVSNDLWNNTTDENTMRGSPVYSLIGENLVSNIPLEEKPESFKEKLGRRVLNRTETYFIFRYAAAMFYRKFFAGAEEKKAAESAAVGKLGDGFDKSYRGSRKEFELFERLVRKTKEDIVDRDGVKLLNTIVSSAVTEKPDENYLRLLSEVEEVFSKEGVETINFDSLFRNKFKETGELPHFINDAHWNEIGHRWVARELYGYIRKQVDELNN